MDIFVGRARELEAIDKLLRNEKGVALVVGETGIGKSRLLAQVCHRYVHEADLLAVKHVCRFSDDEFGPFVSSLAGLVSQAVGMQRNHRATETGALTMTGLALTRLGRTFGLACDFVVRVLEEVNLKLGPLEIKAEKIFRIADEVWRQNGETQPSLDSAKTMLSEHAPSFIERYAEIMGSLRQDLPGKKLLIILDQVERARGMTLDMLLDFAEVIPSGVYLLLAVNEEVLSTERHTQTLYQDFTHLEASVRRLGGLIVRLSGLAIEEIGDWIEKIRERRPPDIELRPIRRATAGLPLLVEEAVEHDCRDLENLQSLSKSEYLDYCYERRLKHLKQDTLDFAYRLSVLQESLTVEDYPVLLELGGRQISLSECDYLQRQLKGNLVFNSEGWFRHETIKDYCERRMPPALCTQYHLCAAKFFQFRMREFSKPAEGGQGENVSADAIKARGILSALNWGYHLHRAGETRQFVFTNQELFEGIITLWVSDSKSMQNLVNGITCLEKLYDYSRYVGDIYLEVQVVLWLGRMKSSQAYLQISESAKSTRLYSEAKQLYERGLELAKSLPHGTSLMAEFLQCVASTEWCLKNHDRAIQLTKESLKYRRKLRARKSLGGIEQAIEMIHISECLLMLSDLEYEAGNIGVAARYCKRYLRLIFKVTNAELDRNRTRKSSETHDHARSIIDALYLLGQLYEARKGNRKAVMIYSLLEKCYPDFRPYKDAKTTTELLKHLKGRVGRRRFKRYRNEAAEIGFVPDKDWMSSTYRLLDIINHTLL